MRYKISKLIKQIALITGTLILAIGCEDVLDNQAPTLQVLSPEEGQEIALGDTMNFAVRAEDDKDSLKEVRFYMDGRQVATDCTATQENRYEVNIPIIDAGTGELDISVEAIDLSGVASSEELVVDITMGIAMIDVEGGTYQMGCSGNTGNCQESEKPVHTVTLDGYKISKHEITNLQFTNFLNEIGVQADGTYNGTQYLIDVGLQYKHIKHDGEKFVVEKGYAYHPVNIASWYGAQAFCSHYGGKLPTEAQWEFAARGGNQAQETKYSGSDFLDDVAWGHMEASEPKQVGTKAPNELGIYDMTGNLVEWCFDFYSSDYYSNSPQDNPEGPSASPKRVLRGGDYWSGEWESQLWRRFASEPIPQSDDNGEIYGVGFRMAK